MIEIPDPTKPENNTVWHVFGATVERHPQRDFLGHRSYEADGSRGAYQWQQYKSAYDEIVNVGLGLVSSCGLTAKPGSGPESQPRVGTYSIHRPECTKVLLALFSQRLICSPLYDTLGPNAVRHIVEQAEISVVACERAKCAPLCHTTPQTRLPQTPVHDSCRVLMRARATRRGRLKPLIEGKGSCLKYVVLFEEPTEADKALCKGAKLELLSLSEVAAAGKAAGGAPQPPSPDDWSYIMYTSGTTGDPKGVCLSHRNILAPAAGLKFGLDDEPFMRSDDVYISYLPMAHIFEVCMQMSIVECGAAIGYFQGDVKKLVSDDLPDLKPTAMAGVPRVYARIYDKVMANIEAKGTVAKHLFRVAKANQSWCMSLGFRNPLWDLLLFNKVKEALGGRVRLLATGAAPLGAEVHDFLRICFGVPVSQGYGMTENAAAALCQPLNYLGLGNVGGPIPCTECKLEDTDLYTHKDVYPATAEEFEEQFLFKGEFKPEMAGKVVQRGEVLLRGPNVMLGYYKMDKETKETLDADGWLHTGDIGQWAEDGALQIIDRKKNIFKLAQGECVPPPLLTAAIHAVSLTRVFCSLSQVRCARVGRGGCRALQVGPAGVGLRQLVRECGGVHRHAGQRGGDGLGKGERPRGVLCGGLRAPRGQADDLRGHDRVRQGLEAARLRVPQGRAL